MQKHYNIWYRKINTMHRSVKVQSKLNHILSEWHWNYCEKKRPPDKSFFEEKVPRQIMKCGHDQYEISTARLI